GVSLKGATWCCLYVTLPRGDGWSEDGRGGSRDRTRSPQIEVSWLFRIKANSTQEESRWNRPPSCLVCTSLSSSRCTLLPGWSCCWLSWPFWQPCRARREGLGGCDIYPPRHCSSC